MLWSSLGVGLLVIIAGSLVLLFAGLTLAETAAVAALGSLVGALMLAAAARPGVRAGVPTMVSLRPILGRKGSIAPSILNVGQLVGWAIFELYIMGTAAAVLTANFAGPYTAAFFVPFFGAVVWLLAWSGPLAVVRAWLERFAIWLVYGSTALVAVALATRGLDLNARPVAASYSGPLSWLVALDLVIAMPISWWPLVADYNRFAKSERASLAGTTAGFAISNTAFYVLGAALLVVALNSGIVDGPLPAIGLLGLGAVPLLIILVDETDNAFANVYSTAVSAQNVVARWRQPRLLTAATIAATAGAAALVVAGGALSIAYEGFLLLIGGIFVPLLGVVIADAYLVRRAGYRAEEFEDGSPPYRWRAFAAWAPATVLYFVLYWAASLGWPLIGASLPSFALAAGLHLALNRSARGPNHAPNGAGPGRAG